MARKEGDERRLRQQREPLGNDGSKQRRAIAKRKKDGLARAGCFHHGRYHGASSLSEIAIRSKFRTQIRQRFHRSQKLLEIGFLQSVAEVRETRAPTA